MERSAASIVATGRWTKVIILTLGVIFLLMCILGFWVSREPKIFWVNRSADQQSAVVGFSTVDTLIRVAETLLEKNGGYLTNVVITETTRFKAAASGAGHSLIEANFGHDIYQHWYNWELGTPWEDRENYDRLSPFLQVGRVETPTLFLGGRIDWNVPILNAELMYQALRVRGIDAGLVVYPEAHHGGWPDEYEQDYLVRVIDWFDKHTSAD